MGATASQVLPDYNRPSALLSDLLRDVSRTFYWTMRVLPGNIRPQVGLAYLLARTTDTIADTEAVTVSERLLTLRALRERILGQNTAPLLLEPFLTPGAGQVQVSSQGSLAERTLLRRTDQMLALLNSFSEPDQQLIREVLSTITSGQELDLQRFGEIKPGEIRALQSDRDLDDYTYRVAGCVGEFWTRICRAHLFPKAALDEAQLVANGIRFGKGLQLVNILRDVPADLRLGRCYVPSEALASHGLTAQDLLHPQKEPQFRSLYTKYLDTAQEHLAAGWIYTNTLPRKGLRLRLACAWPILIGVKTLAKLREGNVLDATLRIKISRAEVKSLMLQSLVALPWPRAWQRLYTNSGGIASKPV